MSDIPESLALNLESWLSWLREIVQTTKQPHEVKVWQNTFKYVIAQNKKSSASVTMDAAELRLSVLFEGR